MKNFSVTKKVLSIISLIFLGAGIALISFFIYRNSLSPSDSSAIYGGRVDETGYPSAGYLISYTTENKASVCGLTLLDSTTAISSAHCISEDVKVMYSGAGSYTSNLGENVKVVSVEKLPDWNGKNNSQDLAVLKLGQNLKFQQFAQIDRPLKGCGYEVLGYGNTEIDDTLPKGKRFRKSAKLCLEKIENNLLYFKGDGGGICFGDSGSPVYKSGTNSIVGVISGIVSTNASDDNYCHVNNTAVAVDIFKNRNFIQGIQNVENAEGKCGFECNASKCNTGLICEQNICRIEGKVACIVLKNNYCSSTAGISCQSGLSCINNICTEDNVSSKIISSGFSFSLGSVQLENLETEIYIVVGTLLSVLILVIFIKLTRSK